MSKFILTVSEIIGIMTETIYHLLLNSHSRDFADLKRTLIYEGYEHDKIDQCFEDAFEQADRRYSQQLLQSV